MALSDPRVFFGIHSITPYNTTTGAYYGTIKVMQGSNFALTGETIDLTGGSSRYPYAVEDGKISAELALTASEYPDFLYSLFLGKAPTANSAEATGNASTLTNKSGTSVVNADGIDSVEVTSGDSADLKFGKYVVSAVTSSTVDVFLSSDVDIARGTDGVYENDLLKITSTPITITSGSSSALADYGINIVSGAGTIDMTVGDTATFEVRPVNSASSIATFGANTDVFPEFGALVYAQQRGNGQMVELDIFKCKALGMPHNFSPAEFSQWEVTAKAFYDSSRNGVFSMRVVTPA